MESLVYSLYDNNIGSRYIQYILGTVYNNK